MAKTKLYIRGICIYPAKAPKGNSIISYGWRIEGAGMGATLFGSLKKAKEWVEERYEFSGWSKQSSIRVVYANPLERKITVHFLKDELHPAHYICGERLFPAYSEDTLHQITEDPKKVTCEGCLKWQKHFGFLLALHQNQSDYQTRLIYADWLLDQNEPACTKLAHEMRGIAREHMHWFPIKNNL